MVFRNPPGYSHVHGMRSHTGTSKRYSVTISSNLSPVELYIAGPCLTSSSNKNNLPYRMIQGYTVYYSNKHILLREVKKYVNWRKSEGESGKYLALI